MWATELKALSAVFLTTCFKKLEVSGVPPGGGSAQPLARKAVSLIEKENERRTSNTERPTSNSAFCHFIKITEQSESTLQKYEIRLL